MREGFAVWITGLPASGKSSVTAALAADLRSRGIEFEVLESDVLRRILTPVPRYDEAERNFFYGAMAWIGRILVSHGVAVIFDATANRRAYRDRARGEIPRFLEVFVDCPASVCEARDPKGIYRRAREGTAPNVPGIQAAYEPPLSPDLVVRGDVDSPSESARRIAAALLEKGMLG